MNNHLSEKMCRFLSSLAPGFDGHWVYVNTGFEITIMCRAVYQECIDNKRHPLVEICPAWQAEDLLRNITEIQLMGHKRTESSFIMRTVVEKIVDCLAFSTPNTAYQKIEEYLWQILWINKEVLCCGGLGSITKGECGRGTKTGCVGMHCKCMQKDCSNMHYVDCREHYIHVEYLEK